jgi:hypothetical protein
LFQLHELGAAILSPVRATVKYQKQAIWAREVVQRPDGAGLIWQGELRNALARIWAGRIAVVGSPEVTLSHLGWNRKAGVAQPPEFSHGCRFFRKIVRNSIHATMVPSCNVLVSPLTVKNRSLTAKLPPPMGFS